MPRKQNNTSTDFGKPLASHLRELVKEKKSTLDAIGNYVGVSRQMIGYYCDGSHRPDWETIVKLAEYFEVSTDWLLGVSDYRNPKTRLLTLEEMGLSETAANRLAGIAGAAKGEAEYTGDADKILSPVFNPNGYSLKEEADAFRALNLLLENDNCAGILSGAIRYAVQAPSVRKLKNIKISDGESISFSTSPEVLLDGLWHNVDAPLRAVFDNAVKGEGGANDGKQ